jgi:hypothetical protein
VSLRIDAPFVVVNINQNIKHAFHLCTWTQETQKTCTLSYNLKILYFYSQNMFSDPDSWWNCFLHFLNCVRTAAWKSIKNVTTNFFGNHQAVNYLDMVAYLVQYKAVGCNVSLKVHFLGSHWDFLPENLKTLSNDHKQLFHQDISTVEKQYQGKCSTRMLADYCWTLRGDVP